MKGQEILGSKTILKRESSLILVKDSLLILIFATLTGFGAKIKLEIGPVPITLQTFFVLLSGLLLGAKRAFFSQGLYLTMGLLGVPWFSRGGGLAYILSPTFGYIIGFVFGATILGFLARGKIGSNPIYLFLLLVFANYLIYIPGLIWLSRFLPYHDLFRKGLFPFVVGDFLKIFLLTISSPLWKKLQI